MNNFTQQLSKLRIINRAEHDKQLKELELYIYNIDDYIKSDEYIDILNDIVAELLWIGYIRRLKNDEIEKNIFNYIYDRIRNIKMIKIYDNDILEVYYDAEQSNTIISFSNNKISINDHYIDELNKHNIDHLSIIINENLFTEYINNSLDINETVYNSVLITLFNEL